MKYIAIILLLFSVAMLNADAPFYPTTTVIENFGADWCGACTFAIGGLIVLEDQVQPGEVIISRLLTESGEYSNAEVDGRFDYYGVIGLPAVIFNGKVRVDGADHETSNGGDYIEALGNFRYLASPVKMELGGFDSATGEISATVQMLHDSYDTGDATLHFYLVEDEITSDLTRIVRSVKSQPVSLSGAGNTVNLSATFTTDPSWDSSQLWAFAFLQTPAGAIIQSVSSEPLPEYHIQAAVPFDHDLQSDEAGNFISPEFWIYNMGAAETHTFSIETVSAPDGWYLNYCEIGGNCLPGSIPIPHEFTAGEAKGFDLNITAPENGTAVMNFVIESPNIGTYKIPFSYTLGPVSNEDLVSSPHGLSVKKGFPNPFQSRVSFDIQSPKAGLSTALEIYNVRGQKVQELPLTGLKQGISTIDWDAAGLPDGLYFYRLKGTRKSGKVIKLR